MVEGKNVPSGLPHLEIEEADRKLLHISCHENGNPGAC
jgi:hypothetical protein